MKITKPYHVITPEKPVVLEMGTPQGTLVIDLAGGLWKRSAYWWCEHPMREEALSQKMVNAVQVLIPHEYAEPYKSGEKDLPVIGVIEVQE